MAALPLAPGIYRIRFIPEGANLPIVGGEYASSKNGINHPVGTEAEQQSVIERIEWRVNFLRHEGGIVLYDIRHFGPGPMPAWTHATPFPGGPVMLSNDRAGGHTEWVIQKEYADVYNIMALAPPGLGWCVDRNEETGDLYVKGVPIGGYLSRWEFIRTRPLEE